MTAISRCGALGCHGIADDGLGLCGAHRAAVTLTVKVQDAVREFLHGSITPTAENVSAVTEAGTYFADGMALLLRALFGTEVAYDHEPLTLQNHPLLTWRVLFSWTAALDTSSWREETRVALMGADGDEPC